MYADDVTTNYEAIQEHDRRTADLTEDEKKIYNDGYLWASADAVASFSNALKIEGLSDAEKIEFFEALIIQASIPLLLASLATGKDYLAE